MNAPVFMTRDDALDAVRAPLGQARGLPNNHYVEPATFDAERRALLFSSWAGVGFGKDVPNPGDAIPVDFLGMPLLLVRDHDGSINVFQNTCRHRGMILVDAPKRIEGVIRCPYHSWCYQLSGELRSTPHVGGPGKHSHPDLDKSSLGLWRFRSHVWHDVVFVNVDGEAPAFDVVHAGLLERWAEFEQPMHYGGDDSSFTLEVNSNWKLAVENFCEAYHLPMVHPALNSYSCLEDHYDIASPDEYSGQGTHVYRQLRGDTGEVFPDFDGVPAKWNTAGEYIAVYPNVLLGVHRDHCFSIVLEPVAIDRTVEHISIYYARSPSDTPELDGLRVRNAAQWKVVFAEDVGVVEGMQRGRRGELFDGGRFSPVMDGPTHNFHKWVATRMARGQ